jgi:hypothetical protein
VIKNSPPDSLAGKPAVTDTITLQKTELEPPKENKPSKQEEFGFPSDASANRSGTGNFERNTRPNTKPEVRRPDRVEPPQEEPRPQPPTNRFRIVEVMLRADPFDFTGPCPKKIVFSGQISVAGSGGVVSYKFLRNDGASAPVETITFDGPGTKYIQTTWQLGATYSGWQQIQILDPVEQTSNKAEFNLTCQ